MPTVLGVLVVALGGLVTGSAFWPMKIMRKFQFEHWWFVGCLVGFLLMPWAITLLLCPHAFTAYGTVDALQLLKANVFSVAWGVANILCGLCFVRLGFALTGGVLTGLGASVGVTLPMVVKGSGLFSSAPNLNSPAGRVVLLGVAVMLAGVVFVSLAGFGRDRALGKVQKTSGSFLGGWIMVVLSGVLSAGISFAFVYSQGPIVAAMKANGAGNIPANFAVWAVGLLGGAFLSVIYAAYLMTVHRSWGVLGDCWQDFVLAALMGINLAAGIALLGRGMLLLGVLGASVGFGIQQAMQMLGSQGVGFMSGEWRGVFGTPRHRMYLAIGILILAAVVMAYGNTLAKA